MIKKFYLPIVPIILIVLAFAVDGLSTFSGFLNIIKSPSVGVDYLSISFGGTLLNVALMLTSSLILLYGLKLRITGPILAGLFSIVGCGFYGANIINVIPIHIGLGLYAGLTVAKYKNNIIQILFSVGISPIVSFLAFGLDLNYFVSIPIAILVGIVVGFIIPAISSHVIIFHGGYNLFNVGFALGIISMVINGILYSFNIKASYLSVTETRYHWILVGMLGVIAITYLVTGLIISNKELKRYKELIKRTGRLVTDFIRDYGVGLTMINISLMSIICILLLLVLRIPVNGVLFGSIIMILGFSSFGIHPRNSFILVLSSIVMALAIYFIVDYKINPVIIFLVMGLSPVAGRFGLGWGIAVGLIHTAIVPICATFQGGFDLFNNGFAAGFTAGGIIPLIENFRRKEE